MPIHGLPWKTEQPLLEINMKSDTDIKLEYLDRKIGCGKPLTVHAHPYAAPAGMYDTYCGGCVGDDGYFYCPRCQSRADLYDTMNEGR